MDGWLKQSTAVTVKIGPFVDSTGAATTGLTIAQADVRLSKNGGNMAQKNEASSCAHDELGLYDCALDTTDTATLGRLEATVSETGALIQRHTWQVVSAQFFDMACGSTRLPVQQLPLKNTALANFHFVMTDSTNHAPATGKTVTVTRSIDGGAFAAGTLANVTEKSNGVYTVDFGAGDLNGSVITIRATATACDDTLLTLIPQP